MGGVLGLAGLAGLIFSIVDWQAAGFGRLNYEHALRVMVPSVTALTLSCQTILGGFFLSILNIYQTRRATIAETVSTEPSDDRHIAIART